jgi:hypothetical protein
MFKLRPLFVDNSGLVKGRDGEERYGGVVDDVYNRPFYIDLIQRPDTVIVGLDWLDDVILVVGDNASVTGDPDFRTGGPVSVRVYFTHIRKGTNITLIWQNRDQPRQNERYGDYEGICSSPDPFRVAVVAAALRMFGEIT